MRKREIPIWTIAGVAIGIVAATDAYPAQLGCSAASFPSLPDVRLVSTSAETAPVPHCKVAGVIGTETNFELLLPVN